MKAGLLAALLVLVAACGDADVDATTTVVPTTEPPPQVDLVLPTSPDEVVLRIFVAQNQPDPLPIAEAFPEFTLYGDGRLITRDRDAEFGPLAALEEAYLTPAGIQLLVAEWVAAGAAEPLDRYGFVGIADGDSTRFYLGTESPVQFSVGDLGSRPAGPAADVTDEQLDARRRLGMLVDTLREYESLVADEIVSGPEPLTPDRVAIIGLFDGAGGELDFPFDLEARGESIDTRVQSTTCLVVSGPEVDVLLDTVEGAPYLAPWRIDGDRWALVFRPVLPDEDGCAILVDQ